MQLLSRAHSSRGLGARWCRLGRIRERGRRLRRCLCALPDVSRRLLEMDATRAFFTERVADGTAPCLLLPEHFTIGEALSYRRICRQIPSIGQATRRSLVPDPLDGHSWRWGRRACRRRTHLDAGGDLLGSARGASCTSVDPRAAPSGQSGGLQQSATASGGIFASCCCHKTRRWWLVCTAVCDACEPAWGVQAPDRTRRQDRSIPSRGRLHLAIAPFYAWHPHLKGDFPRMGDRFRAELPAASPSLPWRASPWHMPDRA